MMGEKRYVMTDKKDSRFRFFLRILGAKSTFATLGGIELHQLGFLLSHIGQKVLPRRC